VISTRLSHSALVSPEDFVAVQNLRSVRPEDSIRRRRTYLLAGLLRCGLCGRKMDSHWVNDRPGYRCRHGKRSTRPTGPDQDGYLYIREDDPLERLLADQNLANHVSDSHELATHLRQHKITIDCDHTGPAVSTTVRSADGP
jgi:site-specific DNA recombinase